MTINCPLSQGVSIWLLTFNRNGSRGNIFRWEDAGGLEERQILQYKCLMSKWQNSQHENSGPYIFSFCLCNFQLRQRTEDWWFLEQNFLRLPEETVAGRIKLQFGDLKSWGNLLKSDAYGKLTPCEQNSPLRLINVLPFVFSLLCCFILVYMRRKIVR